METSDLTIEILKSIREEIRGTNVRLEAVRDELRDDLDALGRRTTEAEIRTATSIAELAGTVRELTGVLRAQNDLRPRVERCELDIVELRRKLG
jgi:hypothetical protein